MLAKLVTRHLRAYRLHVAVIIVMQVCAQIAALSLPTINADIINKGVVTADTGYVTTHSLFMLAIALGQTICQVIAVYLAAQVAMGTGRDIRDAVFTRTLGFSAREINKFGAPSLITRTTNDVQQVQMLVFMTLAMLIGAPIMMMVGIIMVAVILLAIGAGLIVSRMGPLFKRQQKRIDDLNRVVREQITGIRVVRAFARERHEAARFDATSSSLRDIQVNVGRTMAAMFPLVMLIMNLSQIAVFWFAATRIDDGQTEVGILASFTTYLMLILISVMMAVMLIVMWPRASVCANRIEEVLHTSSSLTIDPEPVMALPDAPTLLEFRDVTFSYPGASEPVLHDISFTLARGTTTAIIGSTGSGKSTLVNLIPRLVDVTHGQVLVNGTDVRRYDPETLWSCIGLVPQRPYLFGGTVASNLRDGRCDATDEELWNALHVAQSDDFVSHMDGKLEATITQGGTNVSGGQRQRLSIARALVKDPDIYIFDDASSALDVATDSRLRAALETNHGDAAMLIVAQRVSTIRNADQILVLDAGHIVGRGTHDELIKSCPTYLEIVDSQLSVEEAA
ncbi:ABC transporter ATP-binding protein/permease [Cutibacterium acnes]|uniref:ABC transporter ATP-binding protein n=1 Tax=Cutibacterium acnes TaxID=1747 RepID=UPI000BFA24AC|nr:ABC transporter ATP-binding protein [Cutibacterium acnes]MCP9388770.1 ABC transporter ATP-binding protein/permease [Cutibacterium acnes]MCP9434111.1 ABC transporter ATP-binding protein/permease [Cutibacterium acnes]PGF42605.1 multidrug ABC transporter ATP-binding protein [Cutibacterium acnes]